MFDQSVILRGEIRFWSLLGLKGLIVNELTKSTKVKFYCKRDLQPEETSD